MAEFASLDSNQPNIPYSPSSQPYGLSDLTNPDNILSGTNRGTQLIGSSTLQIDSTQNLITVKGSNATNANNVLRYGQVSTGFLGMAVNNGSVDTMFAGQDSTGNTVVKIAKTGFDVKTATNDQLVFNSNQNVFKIVASGTSTLTAPAAWTAGAAITNTIPHGLTISPAFSAFVTMPVIGLGFPQEGKLLNFPAQLALTVGAVHAGVIYISCIAYSDTTNFYLSVINTTDGTLSGYDTKPFVCKYYILQESAS